MRYCNSTKKVLAVYGVYSEQMDIMHSSMVGSLARNMEIRNVEVGRQTRYRFQGSTEAVQGEVWSGF